MTMFFRTAALSALFTLALTACGWAEDPAPMNPLEPTKHDRIMGGANAPVRLVEYASMTCNHCADFHKQTLPQLKKDYIDTGKVQYILRDMPWDNMALAASKLARCAAPENYYLVVDAIMASQGKWITAKDPLAELKLLARMGGGLKDDQMDACLKDPDLHQRLIAGQRLAQDALGVKSTPTFFVGADMVEGAQTYDTFKTVIEKNLSAVKK